MTNEIAENRAQYLVKAILLMLCSGVLYAWSVFVKPMMAHHGWELNMVALVGSVQISAYCIGTAVGGMLMGKIGTKKTLLFGTVFLTIGIITTGMVPSSAPWMVYVTYSGIAGFGIGCIYCSAMYAVGLWFPDRKGMAMGAALAAYGGSTALLAPIITGIIAKFGVINTFYIIGVVFGAISMYCAATFKQAPESLYKKAAENTANTVTTRNYTLKQAVKTPQFWAHCVAMAIVPGLYVSIASLFVVFATDNGMTLALATASVSFMSLAQVLGRFGSGALIDKIGWRKSYYWVNASYLGGGLILLFLVSVNYFFIIPAYMFMAAGFGAGGSENAVISMETWGPKTGPGIFGIALLGWVPMATIIPKIALHFKDLYGYSALIMFGMASTFVGVLLVLLFMRPLDPSKFPEETV